MQLQLPVVVALLLAQAAHAVKTRYSHRFEYEEFMSARLNSDGMAARWNSQCPVLEFGMEVGSELIFSVEHADAPVTFSLFNYDQWAAYRSLLFDVMSLEGHKETLAITCMHAATTRVVFDPNVDAPNTTFKIQIATASQYTFQVASCTMQHNLVNASIAMVNLGSDYALSEHLGVEQLGLIPLYSVLVVLYVAGTATWVADSVRHRPYTPLVFYKAFSVDGFEHSAYATARNVCDSVTSTVFLTFLVLCSMGWSWSRRPLTRSERRFFIVLFLVYSTVSIIKATCNGQDVTCQSYMLTEYALKSLVLLGVIVTLNYSISRLQVQSGGMRWQQNGNVPQHYAHLERMWLVPTTSE
ncbi:hypothetical protein AaE_013522 [Aphanomyces astaci]|uniref:GPR180/TMEM145 transmembrane domain-containing protein n=2 Tax=Aphanomyces astaci TaxID=112090 RepID=A0A6A4ZA34_APHAT|nr:hypothetical protein AaE_013522 [Aphanomyces astaci]